MPAGLQETAKGLEAHEHLYFPQIAIYYSCVVNKLLYTLGTLWLTEKQNKLLDSFHARCLRSIIGTPSTWGAMILGQERISNDQVRCQLGVLHLSDEIHLQQLALLGRSLRRPSHHPARILCCDRFLQPQTLGGPYRAGQGALNGMIKFYI